MKQGPNPDISPLNYFDPEAPIGFLSGDLPHWRQEGVTYFVTFRLADSLPEAKLTQWRRERDAWMAKHPEPHDESTRIEYYEMFPQRLQEWLDAGSGSCVLAMTEVGKVVTRALHHFDGVRYRLHESVVAPNHVHAIVFPSGGHSLSRILHSWKSFTAHEISKIEKAVCLMREFQSAEWSHRSSDELSVWQKETFDHIVRNAASMDKFRKYIQSHNEWRKC